ncbi:Uncharacterised protein [Vibrio cholerae]|nr:Uncharacterised protein [Vibrio cholerae]CSI59873.1 Uncharacterised protein [Vibrio cholerae]CSI74656.1 Uncharacterised protein [Vibrio cholerae]
MKIKCRRMTSKRCYPVMKRMSCLAMAKWINRCWMTYSPVNSTH